MESIIEDLWVATDRTCRTPKKEWIRCFGDSEGAAKQQIINTLTNEDQWRDRSSNFLLRLISDDKNGYEDPKGNYKPRVQLALAFVQHMSKKTELNNFLQATINACGREGNSKDREEATVDPWIRLKSTGGSDERRGNGILHEAAKSGTCARLEQFLSETNVDVNVRNDIGETPLHLAAEFQHPKDVEILLRCGATIKVTGDFYSAPQCSHCKHRTSYSNSVSLSVRLSVCLSVCPSHAGIVSKRRHVARCSLDCQIAKCV